MLVPNVREKVPSLFEKIAANLAQSLGPSRVSDKGVGITLHDLKIRTTERDLVQFRPNLVQSDYLNVLQPGWTSESLIWLQGIRDIILKARQEGMTTLIEALIFMDTLNRPYTQSVIIAHELRSTEKIFQMIRRYYDNLPGDKKPITKYASKHEFYWPEIDSSFYVGTAGERDFGRGSTINNVHGSEVASWPDAKGILAGLLQAVPATGNVWLESTAQGVGNYFNTEYVASQEGDSSFTARFFPWHAHKDYRTELPPEGLGKLKPDEEKLKSVYQLSLEQLYWRRNKQKELKELFVQEYPITPEEAFIFTGNSYFDLEQLADILQGLPEHGIRPRQAPTRLRSLRAGEFIVFKNPEKGRKYILAADTAEGINEEGDHDYDSAHVFDAETYEEVCHLHGRWDTNDYGLLLADLGHWYNDAWLGIERNNHGHAVINAVLHNTDYPRMTPAEPTTGLYFHKEYDEKKKIKVRKPGWPTTTKTKFFALDQLANLISSGDIRFRSRSTVRELMNFAKLPGGKAGAPPGHKDDRVMSSAIFAGMIANKPRPVVKKQGWVGKTGGWV